MGNIHKHIKEVPNAKCIYCENITAATHMYLCQKCIIKQDLKHSPEALAVMFKFGYTHETYHDMKYQVGDCDE